MQDISTAVRVLVAERNKKKKEVAAAIGISGSLFSHKIRGDISFSVDELFNLCAYFGISPDYFFTKNGEPA
jgi:transcriptional regulator with XRE-family HTH domain